MLTIKTLRLSHTNMLLLSTPPPHNTVISDVKITVDGTTEANTAFWKSKCSVVPSDTIDIVVVMGSVYDYYRPVPDPSLTNQERFCSMLIAHDKHQWSSDGINWRTPERHNVAFGGSKAQYPRDHIDGDNRKWLSFWGYNRESGGCCQSSFASNKPDAWGIAFTMYFRTRSAAIPASSGE